VRIEKDSSATLGMTRGLIVFLNRKRLAAIKLIWLFSGEEMSQHTLTVTARETTGKEAAKRMRRAGLVPAVAYGHKEEPVKLAFNAKELRDISSRMKARTACST